MSQNHNKLIKHGRTKKQICAGITTRLGTDAHNKKIESELQFDWKQTPQNKVIFGVGITMPMRFNTGALH